MFHAQADSQVIPVWRPAPDGATGEITISDVGLYPLVAAGREDANPIHRAWTGFFGSRVLRRTRLLQNNLGTLQVLLASALALLLASAYTRQWRRSISAEASGRAALALRHQIHRQLYRLGQSSLPSEGAGPAVDLFTREVNDVRNGLIADLERTWRTLVLAAGLILLGLCVSWQITIFLVALAGIVTMVSRPIENHEHVRAEAAARDSAVQLYLLQEDLAMLRTVRVYGIEEIDRTRFEQHLQDYHDADAQRIRAEGGCRGSLVAHPGGFGHSRGGSALLPRLDQSGFSGGGHGSGPGGFRADPAVGAMAALAKNLASSRKIGRGDLPSTWSESPSFNRPWVPSSWLPSASGSASRTCRWKGRQAGPCSAGFRSRFPPRPARRSLALMNPPSTPSPA